MGNSQRSKGKEPDSLHSSQKPMADGCFVFPIAENEDALICTTSLPVSVKSKPKLKPKLKKRAVGNARSVESSLLQGQGRFIVMPKNNGLDSQLVQVKSANPNSKKVYFVPRQLIKSPDLSQIKEAQQINTWNCKEDNEEIRIKVQQ